MRGRMMSFPLTLPALLRRAESQFGHKPIVIRRADRSIARTANADCIRRARQLASALSRAGIRPGDRVATFCWNHEAHLEAYFGVPMARAVLHTLNLRLHPSDLGYIVDHAGDSAILVDDCLAGAFAAFRDRIPNARVIVVGDAAAVPGATAYEDFVASGDADEYIDRIEDENAAAAMCYTSGTTGRPKGVLYSHRALCLHALALAVAFELRESDTIFPIVPMFHANAWGLPYVCAVIGAGLVLPGPHMDPASVLELLTSERVTFAAGVPTVWAAVANALEQNDAGRSAEGSRYDISRLRSILVGGSAAPLSMIKTYEERYGIRIRHSWGMTETGPLATTSNLDSALDALPTADRYALAAKQGWPAPFIELRVMTPDGRAPADGRTMGEIEIRGPWVIAGYYKDDANDRFSSDGWFRTGDIATVDPTGCVHIQDRAKDLIKSGGEWISSVALESALAGHPGVAEAAVIAIRHPHWQERPLALIVRRKEASVTADELRTLLAAQFPKWWLPDAFEFVDVLPRTATGKLMKYALREQYREYAPPAAAV